MAIDRKTIAARYATDLLANIVSDVHTAREHIAHDETDKLARDFERIEAWARSGRQCINELKENIT